VDPDPHGSAFIWLSWIRIWIHIGNADPDTLYVTLQSDQDPAPGFGSGTELRYKSGLVSVSGSLNAYPLHWK
jgi:hypothetical protein